ncbi:hypothetical protein [Rhizobacter sp. OV335]|uniref:hypothetical protein n=1 Tax=Rhizobacter sp. OV335 TaxID=1500264 RepID=UPI0011613ED0|nr:hypothetical protein [Rhizobacter sp. OV335]
MGKLQKADPAGIDLNLVADVAKQLAIESDRGSVVLGVAWMEEELTRLLKARCLPSTKTDKGDELFGVSAPVGTFSAKTLLAWRLGLVSDETKLKLDAFRKLRNEFAHLRNPITFSTPNIKDRIDHLFGLNLDISAGMWNVMLKSKDFAPVREKYKLSGGPEQLVKVLGPRSLIHFHICVVVAGLSYAADAATTIKPSVRMRAVVGEIPRDGGASPSSSGSSRDTSDQG